MNGHILNGIRNAVDTALDRTVVPGYSAIGPALRRRLPSWPADPEPGSLEGREIIVTGASSGLGAQTVADLLALGAHVHLVVRNVDKGAGVVAKLSPDARSMASMSLWQCDISDLDSVRRFVGEFLSSGRPLAGIVHNAGTLPPAREESKQGHEMTMAVHVLGPIALTEGLRPALRGQRARVVFVTSGGMYTTGLNLDLEYRAGTYSGSAAYARSKRAQVELLPLLQERWGREGISVYATHPGWTTSPGLTESLPGFAKLMRPILRSPASGTDTTAWIMACSPRPMGGGLWHDRRARPTDYVPWTRTDSADRRRVWEWVATALSDHLPEPG